MPAYTLYCLDDVGKISSAPLFIAADSDEQAIAHAKEKNLSVRCELWERNRLVASIPAHFDSSELSNDWSSNQSLD